MLGLSGHRPVAILVACWIICLTTAPATAASISVDIPGLHGGDATPGFPDAFSADSLTVAAGGFSITRSVDPLSVALQKAVVDGTIFPSASLALYNSLPPGTADATLSFPALTAASQQIDGTSLIETDRFSSTVPEQLYLVLPGIAGSGSTPGFTGLIPIESFTLAGDQLAITKTPDATTPAIFSAVTLAKFFPSLEILAYDTFTPVLAPDLTLIFDDATAASQQITGTTSLTERDGFSFSSLSQPAGSSSGGPVPVSEPSSFFVLLAALAPMIVFYRRAPAPRSTRADGRERHSDRHETFQRCL